MGMAGMTISLTDNSQVVLSALDSQKYVALDAVGKAVLLHVDELVPKDTGTLANSMSHFVDDEAVVVGTNVEYAKYVEFRDKPHHNPPTQAHFLRDSIVRYMDEYKQLFQYQLTL